MGPRLPRRAVHQLWVGRQTQRRRPRGAFTILTATPDGIAAQIERVAYDAQTVAGQVREAGLPAEYADKLLLAA